MAIQQMLLGGGGEVSLINATGGDEIVTFGNFRYHKFNASGSFQFTSISGYTTYVKMWVVGGGGDGGGGSSSQDIEGRDGGGGGWGGNVVVTSDTAWTSNSFGFNPVTCVVGAGNGYASEIQAFGLNSNFGSGTPGGNGGTGAQGGGPFPNKNGVNGAAGTVAGPFSFGGGGGGGGGGANSSGGQGSGGMGGVGAGSGGQGGAYSTEVGNAYGSAGDDAEVGTAGGGGGGGGAGGSYYATEQNEALGGPGGYGAGGCIIFRYQYKGF